VGEESLPGRASRVRSTRQSQAIEAVLGRQDGFRTVQQLYAALQDDGVPIGLTTVYRYLNVLAGAGRADVVHGADGEARFRLCGTGEDATMPTDDHHHHVVCRVCGRSVEVSAPEIESWAQSVASAAGFTDVTHTVEVFGLCADHAVARTAGR
jgi:Fur family ferric uptake transcriptional regulator